MLPFKKILCPTDFSEPSYEAIKTAGELAFHFGSELCLLHVVSPVPMVPIGGELSVFNVSLYEQELEDSSKRTLEEIVNHLEWKELKTRLIALRGNPADEIVRIAEEEKVDLIVIATRGRTGLDRLIFGSVAEKVVRLAKCPVLIVAGQPSIEARKETTEEKEDKGKVPDEAYEKRKAYQEKFETQLKEWSIKLDDLKARVEKLKAELKTKYEERIEDLKTRQEALQKKLEELKESGEETWEQLRTGIEKSFNELKDSLDHTISIFKEKGEEVSEIVSRKKKFYVQKVEAELKEWGTKIDELKIKAEKLKGDIQIKYLEQIAELRSKREVLENKLRELKESGDEAWEDLKEGVDNALGDLRMGLKRAVARFKKK